MAGDALTPTEMEILELLARGLSNKEMADALSISMNTLNTHMKHIHEKRGLKDRVKILLWYQEDKKAEGDNKLHE